MSLYKRPDSGVYWYSFRFGGRRYRGSTKHTNLRAAEKHENILKVRLANSRSGIVEHKPVPCFGKFADEFLERVKPELRPKSHSRYMDSLKSLRESFALKLLDEITADAIERFKQARMERGLSPCTVNRDLACLRRILLFAVKLDLLAGTPFTAHKVRFLREHGRERILSFEEEWTYLAVATQPLRDVAILILEMGLRPEEACSIRREDVHFYSAPPFVHISFGKTKNAVRDVPLTERARDCLLYTSPSPRDLSTSRMPSSA